MDDPDRIARDLGLHVLELRRARGWTQQQLADLMGMDPRDLRRIEGGDNVTLFTLVRLASALEVTLPSLFEAPSSPLKRKPGRPKNT